MDRQIDTVARRYASITTPREAANTAAEFRAAAAWMDERCYPHAVHALRLLANELDREAAVVAISRGLAPASEVRS